jgi:hypothetical protein
MNTLGMAVDVSHCGDKTSLDACRFSKAPVLITHSNCRALNPGHPRCKTDEMIKRHSGNRRSDGNHQLPIVRQEFRSSGLLTRLRECMLA